MLPVSDQENRSPKSVLSALASETTDVFFSNKLGRSTCLVASGAGSNEHEHENGTQSSAISFDEDSNLSVDRTSEVQTTEDRFTMEINSNSEEEAAVLALKLFSSIVLLTDYGKPTLMAAVGNADDSSLPSVSSKTHRAMDSTNPEIGSPLDSAKSPNVEILALNLRKEENKTKHQS